MVKRWILSLIGALAVVSVAISLSLGQATGQNEQPVPVEPIGGALSSFDVSRYVVVQEFPDSWGYGERLGEAQVRPALRQVLTAPGEPSVRVKMARFDSREMAVAAAEFHLGLVAVPFEQGGLNGQRVGERCWVAQTPWGATVLFQLGPFCVLVGAPVAAPEERGVITEVARKVEAKISRRLAEEGLALGMPDLGGEERREELKALYDFAHWPGKDGPVRDGFKVDASLLPEGLVFRYVSLADPGVTAKGDWLGVYRWYEVTNVDGSGSLNIDVAVMETCAQAQERVIEVFVGSSKPQPPLFCRGGQYGLDLGDVCFAGRQRDGYFHSVMWVRNNVFVRMWASTDDLYPLVEPLARALDAAILQRATFKTYAECASRPVITAVERVTGSEEGPRIEADWKAVELENPRQEEIRLWPFQIPGTGVIFQVAVSESNLIGFPLPGLVPWKWVSPGYEEKNATINAFLQKYQRPPPEAPAQGDEAAPGG